MVTSSNPRHPDYPDYMTGGLFRGPGLSIDWQDGPLSTDGGQNGALVEDVLVVVLQRLEAYNETASRCRENSLAITKVEEALHWLKARLDDRSLRDVLGTYQP